MKFLKNNAVVILILVCVLLLGIGSFWIIGSSDLPDWLKFYILFG